MNRLEWIAFLCIALVMPSVAGAEGAASGLPEGYMSVEESQPILDKTITIRLAPDLSYLSASERETIEILLEVGAIMHELYLQSKHYQSLSAYQTLTALDESLGHPQQTQNLIDLYRLFKGPIGRNLEGELVAIAPVDPRVPGRNVYAWGVTKEQIEMFLAQSPGARGRILGVRTVVRATTPENLTMDRVVLDQNPALELLHPAYRFELDALLSGESNASYYAVPYAAAYAERLLEVYDLLTRAAQIMEADDPDLSRFLSQRALDLLSNNYEAGDAAWVTGRFKNLNAELGSYEVYDDQLFGVKSFFAVSVLVKDPTMDESLNTAVGWLQEFEDMLPYDHKKRVRTDIPIGVYNVVADFGQARGTNTATILPNESYITRKYGRTILLRRNILENGDLFAARDNAYRAAVAEEFYDGYTPSGDFYRTMFHEIGHYVGPDLTSDGRTLDIALEEDSSILEELKADLVSLFLTETLVEKGLYTADTQTAVRCAGIRRVLRKNKPSKAQAYATMEVMQMNYYLEKGLLEYDAGDNRLAIHFDTYHTVVTSMLREVMALQYNGDKGAADGFIERYSIWSPDLHARIADSMKQAEEYRFALVRYAALGE